ncbi:hypothetical protein QJS04_geneDACA001969 [Acorus gramineus]|uniref:CCHC-type domain-containing protein n=1 Tax=Acorus gramineus TaxID=55184 RepID=A0AAV9AAK8_ACOGR|nr:hypothetical protein QJS04_geneDACA001969 [Acorus gramineus]
MVSKAQKLARKRYKEAHPDLFPKPEPPKDPSETKKNKKKKSLKAKKTQTLKKSNPNSGSKKHPLRVPGMRPGESCFICKAHDHIAKSCPQKAQWERNKICLLCRQRGHSLKNCTEKGDSSEKKLCYNCGEAGHSLSKCSQPLQDGGTKFANCFICNQHGHLSKNCPRNTHGIYPKGGSCKICGGVTHLARDCPNKGTRNATGLGNFSSEQGHAPQGRVTKFSSGDDLQDDFTFAESGKGIMEDNDVNPKKKKQGPKVVNFLG